MTTPKRVPSGNDFNYESGTLEPGLGSEQPDEITMDRLHADAAANEARQLVLDQQAQDQRVAQDQLATKLDELDRREAELLRRELALVAEPPPA